MENKEQKTISDLIQEKQAKQNELDREISLLQKIQKQLEKPEKEDKQDKIK